MDSSISVIVPVHMYNEYVEAMLQSLEMQVALPFELVLIFNSMNIEEYQFCKGRIVDSYPQIGQLLVCDYTMNLGANAARTKGCRLAKGDYLVFLDCDDQLAHSSVLFDIQRIIEKFSPDIISINLQTATLMGRFTQLRRQVYQYRRPHKLLHIEDDYKAIISNFGTNICSRFIKRVILNDINFLDLPYAQDWNASSKVFLRAKTFYYIQKPGYLWVTRDNSISRHSSMNIEKHRKTLDSITDVIQFYHENNTIDVNSYFLYDKVVKFCFQYIDRGIRLGSVECFQISRNILLKNFSHRKFLLFDLRLSFMTLLIFSRPLFFLYIYSRRFRFWKGGY